MIEVILWDLKTEEPIEKARYNNRYLAYIKMLAVKLTKKAMLEEEDFFEGVKTFHMVTMQRA